jgi:lambda repressor-like predicted transcriptional regulator
VLNKEKLEEISAMLEYTSGKSLRHLALETGLSKSSAKTATETI